MKLQRSTKNRWSLQDAAVCSIAGQCNVSSLPILIVCVQFFRDVDYAGDLFVYISHRTQHRSTSKYCKCVRWSSEVALKIEE